MGKIDIVIADFSFSLIQGHNIPFLWESAVFNYQFYVLIGRYIQLYCFLIDRVIVQVTEGNCPAVRRNGPEGVARINPEGDRLGLSGIIVQGKVRRPPEESAGERRLRVHGNGGIGHVLVIVKVVVCIVINFFFTMIDKGLFRVGQKARRCQYNGQYGKIKLSCIPDQGTEGAFAISPGTQQAQTPEPAQCQQPEKPVPARDISLRRLPKSSER